MKYLPLLACAALFYGSAAGASPLRCNGKLIRIGMPAAYVIAQCGMPEQQVFQESVARAGTVSGNSRVIGLAISEHWVYDRGWGKFPAVLMFFDGTLKRIDFLPYRSDSVSDTVGHVD